jgi:hypothetical protein
MSTAPTYREQYDRMKRWYARFDAINRGRSHDLSSDYYVDEIYAFFLNCYHLKDWILRDGALAGTARARVEAFINSNRDLRLCADICNSLKHVRLTATRSGESPAFGRKKFSLTLGSGSPTVSLKYQVNTATGPLDAFEIATECVRAWDEFIDTIPDRRRDTAV